MSGRGYPRKARVGQLLREVVAEELERIADSDDRLGLITVTAVEADPDLRRAKVLLASLPDELVEVLEEHRVRLQRAIGQQARLKRTPQLIFLADPGLRTGQQVDAILRRITSGDPAELEQGEEDE